MKLKVLCLPSFFCFKKTCGHHDHKLNNKQQERRKNDADKNPAPEHLPLIHPALAFSSGFGQIKPQPISVSRERVEILRMQNTTRP